MELDPNKLPLTKKVGEVPEDEDKFLSWSGTYGYYSRPDITLNPFKTDKMYSGVFENSEITFNKSLTSSLRDLNKSQVEFKPKSGSEAKMLGKTSSMASFVHQKKMNELMKELGTVENFEKSFECTYLDKDFKSLNNNSLSLKYIPEVINRCLGSDAPDFIVDKFVELSRKNSISGRISWIHFSTLIPIVIAAVDAECRFRRELPALMVLMNRPRIEDKNLGPMGTMSSTNRDNYNSRKELSFADSYPGFVYTKTSDPTNIKNNNPAAQILYAGTTKSTSHLPGFKGHIPMNVRNTKKLEHCIGVESHPIKNDLRLTQRGMGCVLGYAGHVPHETSGPRAERMTACDPRTTTGASFTSHRAFL